MDEINIGKLASPKIRRSIGDNNADEEEKLQLANIKDTITETNIKRTRTELSYLRKSEIKVVVAEGLVK